MSTQPQQVIVIGAGYAGLLATTRLARKVRRQVQNQNVAITLVNATDGFVERLRLHQLAANQPVRQRPIAEVLRGTGVTFVQGTVNRLDPVRRELGVGTGTGEQRFHYDYLIYALGSLTDRDRVPGVRAYAYTLTPYGALSAAALREALPAVNRMGGQLVVCGGGATGIEAAAEFAESYPNLRVKLVTRGAFGQFPNEPIAAYMHRTLTRLGVTIQDGTTVSAVKANELETNAGSIPFDICLWAGGFTVPALARESGLAVNERGQILIDPFMRSISHPTVLAVGDAAYPPEDHGVKVRMSAFAAMLMGAHGADALSAMLQGRTPPPFRFAYLGQGIALGRHDAIGFGLQPDDKPRTPYFTGRAGYEGREFFVRFLADAPRLERIWLSALLWEVRYRYARARQQLRPQPRLKWGRL